jgi:DnaJ-class molecular chaperone
LKNSLVGCEVNIRSHPAHKDGLNVVIPAGTQSGDTLTIQGLGMPVGKGFGDLFVKVAVKVTDAEKKSLEMSKAILQSLF